MMSFWPCWLNDGGIDSGEMLTVLVVVLVLALVLVIVVVVALKVGDHIFLQRWSWWESWCCDGAGAGADTGVISISLSLIAC